MPVFIFLIVTFDMLHAMDGLQNTIGRQECFWDQQTNESEPENTLPHRRPFWPPSHRTGQQWFWHPGAKDVKKKRSHTGGSYEKHKLKALQCGKRAQEPTLLPAPAPHSGTLPLHREHSCCYHGFFCNGQLILHTKLGQHAGQGHCQVCVCVCASKSGWHRWRKAKRKEEKEGWK